MKEKQINIKISNKYEKVVIEFRKYVLNQEDKLYGNLGEYFAKALIFFMENNNNNSFEKLSGGGKFSKIENFQQIDKKFYKFYAKNSSIIEFMQNSYIEEDTFFNSLKNFFKKSDRTTKEYQNTILNRLNCSIIHIPQIKKRIIMSRFFSVYEKIKRFDVTLKMYNSYIKITEYETIELQKIRKEITKSF